MSDSARRQPRAQTALLIGRPHLEARLDEAFGMRLTTVVGGAGFGKTTLLTAWSRDVESAWHTAVTTDRGLGPFARRLVRALRPFVSDISTDAGFLVSPPDDAMRADALATHMAGELAETLDHDLVLIVDDVDELRGTPSAQLVDALVRRGPSTLHVILAGREDPPFPIQRLRGQGQVLELDAAALAFGPDEIGDLLELYLDEDARALAHQVSELTGGWPAAVRLAVRALEQAGPHDRSSALAGLRRPEGLLLDYLSEEVIGKETPAVRRLIAVVAPFDGFTTELCEALGVVESRATVDALRRRGLFVAADGRDGLLTLHAVIREFARERLAPDEDELRELYRRAAAWFEGEGRVEDALRWLLETGDTSVVAGFVAEHGETLLTQGAADAVIQAGSLLTAPGDARVAATLGEAHSLKGNWEEALACYERAAGDDAELTAGLAWRIGRLHWDRGNTTEAGAVFARGRTDGSGSEDEALLLAWSSAPYWSAGDNGRARELADRALATARDSGSARALAAAHNAVALTHLGVDNGRFEQHMTAALEAAEAAGDVLQLVRFTINRCGPAEPSEAVELLAAAITLAELAGAGLYLARALNARGENYLAMGRYDTAVNDLRRALSLWERHGSARRAWALMSLASVARQRGDLAYARAAYREALEASNDAEGSINARSGLARVIAFDDPAEARRLASTAVEDGRRFAPMLSTALLAAGWVALACGDREAASAYASEATAETHRRRTRFEYAEALELAAMTATDPTAGRGLLEESLDVWREVGNDVAAARVDLAIGRLADDRTRAERAERRLRSAGVRSQASGAAGLLACLPSLDPHPVRLRTLGTFALLRDGQAVPVAEWHSRKARDLLKILIARRGRAATRDSLIEWLWPGEDPARIGNRLSVALSVLRSVLDPDRRHGPDRLVAANESGIALRRDAIPIDVDEFLSDAETGLRLHRDGRPAKARESLLAAEAAYAGDFLEEDLYADWAAPLREEARLAYIAVGHALATLASADGELDDAARYLLRVLERDPYDEQAHLALVETLVRAGHHGEARRCYATYTARMGEIGVEPTGYPSATPASAQVRSASSGRGRI